MKNLFCIVGAFCWSATAWCQDAPPEPESPPAVEAEDEAAGKLAVLEKAAAAYVTAYNKGDAAAIAGLFLPEGELVLSDGEIVSGREEIQGYYGEIFARPEKSQAALEAGSVRFLTPGIAMEDGTMHFTTAKGVVISHHYHAVHVLQENGDWLTASVRDEIEDEAPAAEKLAALEWMIGDWIVQKDGAETYMSFDWSKQGPFVFGRALTESGSSDNAASTYRIGWDARRKGFVSWAFDSRGGFSQSDWVDAGENAWLIRTRGVTADGETNQSTQTLALDASRQFFTWSTRDQVIGDEVQPDQSLKIVRRPPEIGAAETKSE